MKIWRAAARVAHAADLLVELPHPYRLVLVGLLPWPLLHGQSIRSASKTGHRRPIAPGATPAWPSPVQTSACMTPGIVRGFQLPDRCPPGRWGLIWAGSPRGFASSLSTEDYWWCSRHSWCSRLKVLVTTARRPCLPRSSPLGSNGGRPSIRDQIKPETRNLTGMGNPTSVRSAVCGWGDPGRCPHLSGRWHVGGRPPVSAAIRLASR
jgi:hypothetical protein